jgi:hypothetical protein
MNFVKLSETHTHDGKEYLLVIYNGLLLLKTRTLEESKQHLMELFKQYPIVIKALELCFNPNEQYDYVNHLDIHILLRLLDRLCYGKNLKDLEFVICMLEDIIKSGSCLQGRSCRLLEVVRTQLE